MWQEVGTAALVGLALSDSWLCLFMGASFAAADRRLSWGFLAGRTIGIVALLLLIGLLGAHLVPSKGVLTLVFGAATIGVAVVLAVSTLRPRLLGGCAEATRVSCDGGSPDAHGGCGQGCEGCPSTEGGEVGTCSSIPEWLRGRVAGRSPWIAGLALGGFRGAMPCLKVLIITPLLVASQPATVVLMALAFALTSTLYPLLGLASGRALSNILGDGRRLRLAAAIGVAAVGIIVVLRYYQRSCDVWG